MPDEETLNADLPEDEAPEEGAEETEEESPDSAKRDSAIEQRLVALEAAQRQSVLEIRSAVGRVQSIAAKLDKTNDPQVEAKLRTELAGVSELLGLVTDSIDESILPRDVKRRVSDAQGAIRAAAADAEINRRIAEATRQPVSAPPGTEADAIEAAVVSQIRSLGLNDQDPAFDWGRAARLLQTEGQSAMWAYFGEVEKTLLEAPASAGPQRRPKTTSPKASGPAAAEQDFATQLEGIKNLDEGVALLRSLGINPF